MKSIMVIVTVALLLPVCCFAQAQYAIDQGSFIVGGSAEVSGTKYGSIFDAGSDTSIISFYPSLLYFVVPNLAIGGAGFYGSEDNGMTTSSSFGIGPAIAYYFGDQTSKIYPFIGASWIFFSDDNHNWYLIQANGGVAIMIAQNVAITCEAFYQAETMDTDLSGDMSNTIGLRAGISAFVF